jgi:hypothetical protein
MEEAKLDCSTFYFRTNCFLFGQFFSVKQYLFAKVCIIPWVSLSRQTKTDNEEKKDKGRKTNKNNKKEDRGKTKKVISFLRNVMLY